MAASWPTVRLILTSYAKDFVKERDVLHREIIPELKIWCETHQLQLQVTDVRWGPGQNLSNMQTLLEEISQCYFNNVMPFFINITSETLGLVPMWGEAPETVINDCMKRLRLKEQDMEFLFAAYREDNNNGVFVIRDDEFLADLMSPEEKRHFIPANILPRTALDISTKTLRRYPKERILRYSYEQAGYDHCERKMVVDIQNLFSTQIVKFIKQRLQQEFPTTAAPTDVFTQMREAQEAFMKDRSHRLRGREDVIKQIEDYISEGGQDVPLLLVGGAGCGKSSVMARTADLTEAKAAEGLIPGGGPGSWHVFYHFVGAAPRSTELDFLLKRLCKELDIIHESALPNDLNAMAQLCCNALANTNTRPVVIFIDALNQFDEDHAALIMSWLPRKHAPHVRCVLSLICDTPQHRTLMSRESKPMVLHMTPLDYEARRQIVQELMAQYRRTLSTDQLNLLLSKKTSENPLWLSMACEELRLVANPGDLTPRIQALPDGLLNLLEEVLTRFASDRHGDFVTATLCLLEASATGLLEEELLTLLGDEQNVIPPSPFDEKDEKEDTEKDCEGEKGGKKKKCSVLPAELWAEVFNLLHPFLRPYGDSREGRLDFYHRAMSKAVRRKFFKQHDENTNDEEGEELSLFWHRRLAAYFERCDNMDRKAEELLYHLCRINDIGRLIHCLTNWDMFDKLFNEEFSTQLLTYWRQVGGAGEMISEYKALLATLEEQQPRDEELLAKRHQHIARIFLQAGKYSEALELATVALKLEEKDLGNRPERMVELYSLMSEIYDEKLKLNDFVSRTQLPDLRKTISYGRKSIALRKNMQNNYHKLKLGLSLMKLAFSLESWEACGGDRHLSGPEALEEGNKHIDTALQIFKELKDDGHYAEALMTKGVLAPRGSMEQLKYYNEAMEICLQVYGEKSLLTSRLYINIGIVWEDNKDYVKAYEYFCKWCVVSEAVLGPTHPKTLRAKGVLKEPRYRLVALRISQGTLSNNPGENNVTDESTINEEVEELDTEIPINEDNPILIDPDVMVQQIWPEGEEQGMDNLGDLREAINELLRSAISEGQLPVNLVTDIPQGNNQSDSSEDDVEEVVRGMWTGDLDNRTVEGHGEVLMGNGVGEAAGGNNGVSVDTNVRIVPGVVVNNPVGGGGESMDNRDLEAREASGVVQPQPQQQPEPQPQQGLGLDNNGDILYDNDAPH